jgi:hypothetical protein
MKFTTVLLAIIICSSEFILSQEYYYTVTDDDSVTYVAASGKLLVLKRDAENNLNLIQSKLITNTNYNSAAVSIDKLLLTSEDTAYVFDISDRLNPIYLSKKYFGSIVRGEKFGDYFIIVKRETSGHSVIWVDADSIRVIAALDRPCNCYTQRDIMCANLTFTYPYAFYLFSSNLLETWEFDNQTKNFYLVKLDDYTPSDYQQFQISSSLNYVFLLLCRDLGGGYYHKYISKMEIETDTLIEEGIINQNNVVPTVGGDWDISEGFHRIVSIIFPFNTQSYDGSYSYDTNINLLSDPLPKITDHNVYQCGNNFYYTYRITNDSLIFKEFTYPLYAEFNNAAAEYFALYQNYPNPFNPATRIQYSIGSLQFVTLKVYDVLGNDAATLVNEEKQAGSYTVEFYPGSKLASGIYFYQLKAGSYTATKKLIILK